LIYGLAGGLPRNPFTHSLTQLIYLQSDLLTLSPTSGRLTLVSDGCIYSYSHDEPKHW